MANNNHTTDGKGKITCDRKILTSIINLATREINGVEGLTNQYEAWYKKFFTKKNEGTKIKFHENGALMVDVFININIGVNVPDIAYRVQENIKNSLATMVGIKPSKINVHVVRAVGE